MTPTGYRAKAKEALDAANCTSSPELRTPLLQQYMYWMRCATRAELAALVSSAPSTRDDGRRAAAKFNGTAAHAAY